MKNAIVLSVIYSILDDIQNFFNQEFWQKVIAAIFAAVVIAILAYYFRRFQKSKDNTRNARTLINQTAIGGIVHQTGKTDSSFQIGSGDNPVIIQHAEQATFYFINYQDGIPQSQIPNVKIFFEEGVTFYENGKYLNAIEKFTLCLTLEKDHKRLDALNIQIGNCYIKLNDYFKAEHFFEEAFREANIAKDNEGIASALVGIGNTYSQKPACDGQTRGKYIQESVNQYKKALKIFNILVYPSQHAMTQNNLGIAYTYLPSATPDERAQNIKNAIECYREALQVYKKDECPIAYATMWNNLGVAYAALPDATPDERTQNIKSAIECFKEALQIRNKDEYPIDYATTQNNLATAYTCLPAATPDEHAQNIKNAIEGFKEVLQIRKKDEYPIAYATTRNNLGNAYQYLPADTPDERAQNVKNAIDSYKEALQIRKKDEYPQDYCMTAANLGMSLISSDIIQGCYWLKEAYSLKEFLPDQGKRLKRDLEKYCEKKK